MQKKALERIQLFRENSINILLNNHKLHGEYFGFRSINITGDFRIIFQDFGNVAEFLKIYPDLTVEMILQSSHGDLIDDGIDIAIYLGDLDDTSMVARK